MQFRGPLEILKRVGKDGGRAEEGLPFLDHGIVFHCSFMQLPVHGRTITCSKSFLISHLAYLVNLAPPQSHDAKGNVFKMPCCQADRDKDAMNGGAQVCEFADWFVASPGFTLVAVGIIVVDDICTTRWRS